LHDGRQKNPDVKVGIGESVVGVGGEGITNPARGPGHEIRVRTLILIYWQTQ